MRLATTLLVSVFTAFFISVSTAHLHVLTRQNKHASRTLVQRQHPLIDICVSLDAKALAGLALLGVPLDLIARLNLCLCLEDLNVFLDTNVEIRLLVDLLGRTTVSSILTALINTSPGRKQCTYPPHSHRLCTTSNPCAFDCDPPYMKVGDTCICTPPNNMCNGRCGPNACGSAVPRSLKPRLGEITTLEQAKDTCKPRGNVCGIAGREPGSRDFECVDWETDLESCGGCVVQHPFLEQNPAPQPQGTDCSELLGVLEVGCKSGRCEVTRCKPGYKRSIKGDSCIPTGLAAALNANPRPGFGDLRMRREKALTTVVNTDFDVVAHPGGVLKVDGIVDVVVECIDLLGVLRLSVPSDTLADNKALARLLIAINALVNATVSFITSPTITSVDTLVATTILLKHELLGCGCADALGFRMLLQDIEKLVGLTLGIKDCVLGDPTSVVVLDASVLLSRLEIPGTWVGAVSGGVVVL